MTVRVFSSSVIVLDEGTLDNVFNGAFTIAVLFKRSGATSDGTQFLVSFDAGVNSNQRGAVSYSAGSALQLTIGGLSRTFGASFTIANDTWYLFVVRKAAGNSVTPTANLYNYATTSWVGWTNGSGTLDNDATALVEARLGNGPGGFPLNGKMAGAVVYNSVLSDVDGETLETSAQNWFDLSPQAMWRPGETDPVVDDTGNGADQTAITGTTFDAVDVPDWDPNLGGGAQDIAPAGIASGEAFGSAVVAASNDIAPSGIASGEAFGAATVTSEATIAPAGIASGEAFGNATVSASNDIAPAGIASGEAFGNATVTSEATIAPTGIASGEAFGSAVVTSEATIAPGGIASGEAFGNPIISQDLDNVIAPPGIGTGEAFGTPAVTSMATIAPAGIASGEAFGVPHVGDPSMGQLIQPVGIPSGERFGRPVVWIHIVRACDCSVLVDD